MKSHEKSADTLARNAARLTVSQPPDGAPVAETVLATAITKISEGLAALTASGLNRKAIVVLLADQSGVSRGDIKRVLDGLGALRADYCAR